ncbi:VCBS domain-containing protein [Novipirellula aureliae]|nr:VCBS domain-containing protein [Novipirellula aureliae]
MSREFDFYPLEDRILLSGDAIDGDHVSADMDADLAGSLINHFADADGEVVDTHVFEPPAADDAAHSLVASSDLMDPADRIDAPAFDPAQPIEVVFIDGNVDDADTLLDGLRADSDVHTQWVVFHLDGELNGIDQITRALETLTGVDAIHIVSHGDGEGIELGNARLDTDSALGSAGDIASWGHALDSDGDILIYGCDLASTEAGQDLIDMIALVTQADVAASDDATGHADLGGDWVLEYAVGDIDHDVAFGDATQTSWHSTLDIASNLVLHNSFDTNADDSSGHNYDGTLASGASINTASETNLIGDGKLSLDGTDDYVDLSAHVANFDNLTQGTISAWVYTDTVSGATVILEASDSGDGDSRIALGLDGDEFFFIVKDGNTNYLDFMTTDANLTTGTWNHVAVTVGTGGNKIYVNGVQQSVSYSSGSSSTDRFFDDVSQLDYLAWGIDKYSGSTFSGEFDGFIDDGRVYDRVLSGGDIQELLEVVDTITVNNTLDSLNGNTTSFATLMANDGGDGISLREAIIAANNTAGADTIFLGDNNYALIQSGADENLAATGDLDITSAISIVGVNAAETTISGIGLGDRIFDIKSGGSLTLNQLAVADGAITSVNGAGVYNAGILNASDVVFRDNSTDSGYGGAIFNTGTAFLNQVSIFDNHAAAGGGIFQGGVSLTMSNVDMSGNSASSHGGAINTGSGTTNIQHSTIVDNSAGSVAGGIYAGASTTIQSSILADNTGTSADAYNNVVSNGYNIIEEYQYFSADGTDITGAYDASDRTIDATTGLAYHTLSAGDVAIDGGGGAAPVTDVLGNQRDENADIGAYEYTSVLELLAHYQFDSGLDATDSSGNGYDGTLVGDAAIDTTDGTNQVGDGKLTLDGTGDYVDLSANVDRFSGLTEGTIAAWVKLSSTSLSTIFDLSDGATSNFASLWIEDGNLIWAVNASGSALMRATSTATINDDAWHHVAVTTDGSGTTLYIDGVELTGGAVTYSQGDATTTAFFDDLEDATSVKLGAYDIGSVGGEFTGLIDDVRVYNDAVNDPDMTELYEYRSETPTDLSATITNGGGLSINDDGGDDVYLLADNGIGSVDLTQISFEAQFSTNTTDDDTTLISYAGGASTNEFLVYINTNGGAGRAIVQVGGNSFVSTAIDYNTLRDGEIHTWSVTWDSSGGAVKIYADGVLVDSGTGINATSSINSGGTLLLGQEQDAVEGGFNNEQTFKGKLYDVRLFNDVRTEQEIAASRRSGLPYDEANMIANWKFDQLSSDGIVVDSVSGNNLTVKHTAESGFTNSEAALTFAIDENTLNGSVVGSVSGVDAERAAKISSLLAAESDLRYSEETGKFYKIVRSTSSWTDAQSSAIATTLGGVSGQLLTIGSAAENELATLFAIQGGGDVWLGYSDQNVEGDFQEYTGNSAGKIIWRGTASGYRVDDAYSNWTPGEPNDDGGQDFAKLYANGLWDDSGSGALAQSIVEWNADDVLDVTDALTYSIQSQTVAGAFAIDASTGAITVADGTLLNYETNPTHSMTVRVTDGDSNTYDEVFTVSLGDIAESNNAPNDLSSGIELNTDGGNDAYLQLADGSPILGGLGEVTFEATFQLDTVPSGYIALIDYWEGGIANEFTAGINADGTLFFSIADSNPESTTLSFAELLDGDQHHFAVTWDQTNGDVRFYVDGQFVEAMTDQGTGHTLYDSPTVGLVIGQDSDDAGDLYSANAFQGTLYDVRIWDEVRSEAEISLNYQNKFDSGSLPSGLVANWQMDGFNGSSEVVDVVNGNNLIVGHAIGAGFVASTPVEDLHVVENESNGTTVGFVVPSDPDVSNDVAADGLFLEAPDPGSFTGYDAGQSFGNWTVDSGNATLIGTTWEASPLGGRSVHLNGGGSQGSIVQTLDVEAGRQYQVVFAVSGNFAGGNETKDYRVSAAGESVDFTITKTAGWSNSNMLWQNQSFTFTADGPTADLRFASTETGQNAAAIADVQVIEIPAAVSAILNDDPTLSYDAATGKFYRYVDADTDWNSALSIATGSLLNGVSGQLVTIRSDYEQQLVYQFATDVNDHIWLGASDTVVEGDYRWYEGTQPGDLFWQGDATGSSVNGLYNNWNVDEPNNVFIHDHAFLSNTDGTWWDTNSKPGSPDVVIEWDASEVLSSFTFSLTDDAGGRFAINRSTGEITVADGALIDYEANTSHSVTVSVTDSAGNSYSEVMAIAVDDVDDNVAPVISSPSGTLPYNENSGPYLIGAASSITDADNTDFDGGQLHLQLTSNALAEDVLDIRNQGTGAGQVGISGTDVTYGGVVVGTYTGPVTGSTALVVTFNSNATQTIVNAVQDNLTYENTSENPSTSVRTIEEYITDGDGGTSNTISGGIQPTQINDAPVMAPWAPVYNTAEGNGSFTAMVSAVLQSSVSDVDTGAVEGLAIYADAGSGGVLEYSIDSGSWTAIPSVDMNNALLLKASDRIRFTPDTENGGSMSLSYYAWDQTSGTAGATADVSSRGGTTAFSTAADTVTINVSDVNDEQVVSTNDGATFFEGSSFNIITSAMLETTDVDNTIGELTYSVTGSPNHGQLSMDGMVATSFTQADINAGRVTYDHYGSEDFSDSFSFSVDDGVGTASTGTFNITLTPINDNVVVITSDGGGATASINVNETVSFVTQVTVSDADLPGDTMTYSIIGGTDQNDFAIDASGNLTFVSPPDYENADDSDLDNVYEVTVRVSDGVYTDDQTITVTVLDVQSTSLNVTTTSDVDDTGLGTSYTIEELYLAGGGTDGEVSLREAITAANNTLGQDTINFAILDTDSGYSGTAGTDAYWQISLTAALPTITESVILDGTSQTVFGGNVSPGTLGEVTEAGTNGQAISDVERPEIVIVGAVGFSGLVVGADAVTVQGFSMYGFSSDAAIHIQDAVQNTVINSNVFGVAPTGIDDPGAAINSFNHVESVGADNGTLSNNIFAYSKATGFHASNGSDNWTVSSNQFLNSGYNYSNGDAIAMTGSTGGIIDGNYFTGSSTQAIILSGSTSGITIRDNTIVGNAVGPVSGSHVQYDAIALRSGTNNISLIHNIIADNYGAGVLINDGAFGIEISENSIYGNGTILSRQGDAASGMVGIDLQDSGDDVSVGTAPYYTVNDAGDADTGGNSLQNFPVISSAVSDGSQITIEGTFNSTANTTFTLEFFDSAEYANGYGQGRTFLGSIEVTTDGSGNASFSTTQTAFVSAGDFVTATATNQNNDETSEFSAQFAIDGPVYAADNNGHFVFDGDDMITIENTGSLTMSTTLTMEAWVKPNDSLLSRVILNKEGEYEIGIGDNGNLWWAFTNTDPGWAWHDTGVAVSTTEWSHVAVSYDNGTVNSYINGELVESYAGSGSIGDAHPTKNDLLIGGRLNNPDGQYFLGGIDDVRVWNVARTQAEIQSNLAADLAGTEAGLVGYYKFDSPDEVVVDYSSAGNNSVIGVDGQKPTWNGISLTEDATYTVAAATGLLDNDVDLDGDALTITEINGSSGDVGSNITLPSGAKIQLEADGSFSYDPGSTYQYLNDGETATETFTYTVSDGNGNTDTATVSITIIGGNDTPVVSSIEDTPLDYSEGDGYLDITSGLTLSDVDNTTLQSAYVAMTAGWNTGQDELLFVNQNGITGSYDSGTGVLTLTGTASVTDYQTALRSVQYRNEDPNPDTTTRTVEFTINDGNADSNIGSRDVTIESINDDPYNNGTLPANVTTFEDTESDIVFTGIDLRDVDGSDGHTLTIKLSTATGGLLFASDGGGVTVTGNQSANMTLTGTLANLNTYLDTTNNIQYLHATANLSGDNADTITVKVNDNGNTGSGGGSDINLGTVNVDITNVNDAPVITGGPDTLDRIETDAGLTGSSTFTVTDPDPSDWVTATVDSVGISGTGSGSVPVSLTNTILKGFLSVSPTAILDDTESTNTLNWDFNSGSEAFDFLASSETLVLTYTVSASDDSGSGNDTVTQDVIVTITGTNDGPVAQAATVDASADGTTINGQLTETDFDTSDTHTYTLVTPTSEGSVAVNTDGTYSFSAGSDFDDLADGESRDVTFVYEVEDNVGASSQATVTITVSGANSAPVAQAGVNTAVEDGTSVSGQLIVADANESDTHTFALIANTSEGSAAVNSDGSYTFDPGADFQDLSLGETREVTFTYEVEDNNGATSQANVVITVTGSNDGPVAQAGTNTATEDGAVVNGTLSETDVDANDTHTYSLVTNTAEGSVTVQSNGDYTFDPGADFQDLSLGETREVTFTYEVEDNNGATSQANVVITVTGTNDGPVAQAGTNTATEDGAVVNGTLSENDVDTSDTHTYSLVTNTSEGSVTVQSNGDYTFEPGADFQDLALGETRDVTFTYEVEDNNGATSQANVMITVTGTNDGPVAQAGTNTAIEDGAVVNGTLSETDVDANDTHTYSLVSNTSEGNVTVQSNGDYAFDPGADFQDLALGETRDVTFAYEVDDGNGGTSQANVVITVTGTNDGPVAQSGVNTATEDGAVVNGTLSETDVDANDTHTYSLITNTAEGSVTVQSNGDYTFEPGADFQDLALGETRDVTFAYEVDDGNGGTSQANVVITVTGTNDGPVAQTGVNTATEDGAVVNGTLSENDVDTSDTHTYSLVTNSSEGSVTVQSNGDYTFDPGADFQDLSLGETREVTFTYEVEDNNGATSQANVVITVTGTNDGPVAQAGTNTAIEDGAVINGTLSETDVDANDTHTYSLVTNTAEGSATVQSNGDYTFDPGADFQDLSLGETREVTFTYEVEDNNGATSQANVVITVTGTNDGPVAQTGVNTATEDGAVVNGTLSETDADTSDTHTYSLVTNTSEGSVTVQSNGDYTFDPGADFQDLSLGETRDVTFTYEVEDNNGATSQANVVITVTGTNDGPVAQAGTNTAIEDGAVVNGTLSETDVDANDTHTYSLVTNTAEGSVTVQSNGDYTFDPGADFQDLSLGETREVTFTYEVEDNNGATSQANVVITVTGTNDGPVAQAGTNTAIEDGAVVNGTLSETDADANDAHTYSLVSNTSEGNVTVQSNGDYAFDPGADFQDLALGETRDVTFTYEVDDGNGGTSQANVVITVTGTNDGPVAQTGVNTATEDGAVVNGTLSETDADTSDTHTYSLVANTSEGSVTVQSNGDYTFDPGADFQDLSLGESREVTFTYEVEDNNGATSQANVVITVTGTNDGPVAQAGTNTAIEDGAVVNGTLSETDVDANDTHTYSLVTNTAEGSVTVQSNGDYTFEPGADFQDLALGETRDVTFTYEVDDGNGGTSQANVVITVTGTNDGPVAQTGVNTATEDGAVVNGTLSETDADTSDTHTYSLVANTSEGSVTVQSNGDYTFEPGADFQDLSLGETREVTFTYEVEDNNGATSQANVVITVTGTNDGPVAQAGTNTAIEDGAVVIGTLSETDVDANDTHTYSLVSNTTEGSVTVQSNGDYTFEPGADFQDLALGETRDVTFAYEVDDGNGGTSQANVVITVTGTNAVAQASSL